MARDSSRSFSLFLPRSPGAAGEPHWSPPADIYATPGGWLIKFDLAGVRPSDLRLTVESGSLVLRGERRDTCLEEGCRHYRMEITYSNFERRVDVPADFTEADLQTDYRDGMLLVRVTREGGR